MLDNPVGINETAVVLVFAGTADVDDAEAADSVVDDDDDPSPRFDGNLAI